MGPSPLRFPTQNSLHYNSFLDCFKWEIGVFLNGILRSLFFDVVFSCRGGSLSGENLCALPPTVCAGKIGSEKRMPAQHLSRSRTSMHNVVCFFLSTTPQIRNWLFGNLKLVMEN